MSIATKKTYQWELQQRCKNGDGKCEKCGRVDHLTVDHIIPLQFLLDLGYPKTDTYNDKDNLQILCTWCNRQKGNRLDHLNSKTIPLLQKYVDWYKNEITK